MKYSPHFPYRQSGIRPAVSTLRWYRETTPFWHGIRHGAIICISGSIYNIAIYLQISMRQSQTAHCKQAYRMSNKISNLNLHLIFNQAIQVCVNKEAQNIDSQMRLLFLFPQFSKSLAESWLNQKLFGKEVTEMREPVRYLDTCFSFWTWYQKDSSPNSFKRSSGKYFVSFKRHKPSIFPTLLTRIFQRSTTSHSNLFRQKVYSSQL